jgi:hypothetical protein
MEVRRDRFGRWCAGRGEILDFVAEINSTTASKAGREKLFELPRGSNSWFADIACCSQLLSLVMARCDW